MGRNLVAPSTDSAIQDRPWSPAEAIEMLPEIVARLEQAITSLLSMGRKAAESEWEYRKAKAIGLLKADGKNAEAREAQALLTEVKHGGQKVTVADLGLRRDLAENAYRDQRIMIQTLDTEARLIQSLMVSGRGSTVTGH